MSFFGRFFGSQATASVVDSLANAGDRLFTSDDERLKWQAMMQKIKAEPATLREFANVVLASSTSPFVAGGRSALMYGVAFVLIYQLALRDILVIVFNRPEMCAPLINADTLNSVLGMFFGGAL